MLQPPLLFPGQSSALSRGLSVAMQIIGGVLPPLLQGVRALGLKSRPLAAASKCGAGNVHTVLECNSPEEPVILDHTNVAWTIVATWIIGLCLIALIRAWIRRNETPRHQNGG